MRSTIHSHMAYPKSIASTFRAVAPTLFGLLQLVLLVVEVVLRWRRLTKIFRPASVLGTRRSDFNVI